MPEYQNSSEKTGLVGLQIYDTDEEYFLDYESETFKLVPINNHGPSWEESYKIFKDCRLKSLKDLKRS